MVLNGWTNKWLSFHTQSSLILTIDILEFLFQ